MMMVFGIIWDAFEVVKMGLSIILMPFSLALDTPYHIIFP